METLKSIKTLIKNNKGLDHSQILYKIDSNKNFIYPDKVKKDFELIDKKWSKKEKSEFFKNKENLCISHFHIKDKKIYLNFTEAPYIQKQIVSECLGMIPDIEQELLINDIIQKTIKMPLAYKMLITVITQDNKIVLTKRSSKVSTNKGKFDISISKSVTPEDMTGKIFQPYTSTIRALSEELNIDLDFKKIIEEDLILIREFNLNKETFTLGCDIVVDLRKSKSYNYTEEEIKKLNLENKTWDISEILFINNTESGFKKELKKYKDKLSNYSIKKSLDIIESFKK